MPHGEPKPDAKAVDELGQHLSLIWNDVHSAWDTKLSYYEGTFQLWPDQLKDLRRSYHPPTAASKVDGAVNSLLAIVPKVHRTTSGGKREEAKGDKIEPWMSAILEDTSRREALPHIRQSKQNLMLLGWTVLEGPTLDSASPPEKPEHTNGGEKAYGRWEHERAQWQPIRLSVPAPKTVLIDPFERIAQAAVKEARWYVRDLLALLEQKKLRKYAEVELFDNDWLTTIKNPYEQIACKECWTLYWHALKGPKGMMFIEENITRFVPFTGCFTGWGQSYTGTESTLKGDANDLSWSLKAMSRGILDGNLETLKLEAQGMTGLHEALIRQGMKKLISRLPAAETAEQMEGDIIEGNPDDFKWLEDPGVQAHVFQTIEGYRLKIEENTFPAMLVGVRPEGVTTVGQHALLRKDGVSKFAAPMENMSQMYTIFARNTLRLVDLLDEEITAGGETIGPKEIDGNYDIRIDFESSDPIVKFQEQQMAREDVAARLMSRETYFAIKGQEDATGEERRIMEDAVMQSPDVQGLIALVVKQGLGLADLQAQVAQLQAAQAPKAPGGTSANGAAAGMPPSTEVVPEGSPQEAASVAQGMEGLQGA